jgi:dihydroneopterin aldolase
LGLSFSQNKDIEKLFIENGFAFISLKKMGKIYLNRARFYAYHGCMEEEGVVGGDYVVDVVVEFDLSLVEKSHAFKDTVDYVEVFNCVKKEMKKPAKLLETLLERTASSLKKIHPSITSVDVKIEKTNPPVGGDVGSVAISKKV